MSFDHPVHPATVHWPIAFFSLAYGLDVLYAAPTYLGVSSLLSPLSQTGLTLLDIGRGSYYLHILGVLTAVPAVMSGGQQLVQMVKNGGLYESDGKTLRKKVKMTLAHAFMNDTVLLAGIWTWWSRSSQGEKYVVPAASHVLLSLVMLPTLLWSANLGGTLVYNMGTGLSLGKSSKKDN